ncbi:unnamed protein product [Gongylonema pulchrum]|uniref:Protein kinase domain-containing protein n=1 Tax=Gongylonema pulchrum TaxID=637853 RepID=A0A183D3Q0_9BILA|nr:unnamed protein product [Gongylonema pulchrum]
MVYESKDNSAPLKLTGFGVSMKLPGASAAVRAGRVGVSHFMAPEVVNNMEYGTKADMWSAGVLLYILLCGRLPFVGTRQKVYESISEGRYTVITLPEMKELNSQITRFSRIFHH